MAEVTFHPYPTRAKKPRKGKYGSYSATYNGYTYMSRKEALYAAELDLLKKAHMPANRVVSYQRQVKVPLHVNGKVVANYYCDFLVKYADGREEFQEVKGFETAIWKRNEKHF